MAQNDILPVIPIKAPVTLPHTELKIEVGRSFSKNAVIQSELMHENEILLVFQKDNLESNDAPTLEECYNIGILARFQTKIKLPNTNFKIRFSPFTRVEITAMYNENDCLKARYTILNDIFGDVDTEKFLLSKITTQVLERGNQFLKSNKIVLDEINKSSDAATLSDVIAHNLMISGDELYKYLEDLDVNSRLEKILTDINSIFYHKELDKKIDDDVRRSMEEAQKEYYLREKIRAIQKELGDIDNNTTDIEKLRTAIKEARMPKTVEEHALKELTRYQSVSNASPESSMIRSYLDVLIDIPWYKETVDEMNIEKAKAKLDETHFGLDKVKDRILEYLSVKLYTQKNPQTILCFVGPPGVGKTTLAASIAEALGRKFVKQSLGGVKDESEIRGHRRTYIGSLPGRIINGMRAAKVTNPVFLLDEIDKVGADYKGDPEAALLEVLDPEQNKLFSDNYVEENYDLSKVMFICTANYLENIPAPLMDRMEIIELSSYTEIEKFNIAKTHLIDRELKANGLEKEKFELTDEALKSIIKYYTREAGVRQLERHIGTLMRKSIRKILNKESDKIVITAENLKDYLGKPIFSNNVAEKDDMVGVVTGLAWTQFGGDTLQIEVTTFKGKGGLQLTGKLGDVMKESAQAAFTWVKSHAKDLGINEDDFSNLDTHVHVPEGAVPKDGPSAGVTIATAIASAFTHRPVHHEIGMTGEITLRGRVLPIGGLREKSIAAVRSGLKTIIIPQDNLRDLDDIPKEVKEVLNIVTATKLEDVLNRALV
ncbi:MAG: endopeptidase La [Gammaproteobacteria bacterium]|nr:endopeptidase La [Gammaproteobacteria bacterium]